MDKITPTQPPYEFVVDLGEIYIRPVDINNDVYTLARLETHYGSGDFQRQLANADFIVTACNNHQKFIDLLDELHLAACYGCEENIDAQEDMLRLIANKITAFLAPFQTEEVPTNA